MSNWFKNTPIKIEVDVIEGTTSSIQFKIIDTGIGIQKDKLESLCDAFQQLDASTSRKYGGTGLGLSISRSLIAMQQGTMNIQSEPGKGSVFSFTIDYAIPSKEQKAFLSEDHHTDTRTLTGIRILIAEDNEYNRIVVNDTLENMVSELTIHHAENGILAVEMLEKNDYDLIIMDVNMPVMDGFEATRHIRKNMSAPKKDIPIIALTASVLNVDIRNCFSAGMNAYITKPFKREDLIGTLAKFYSNPSAQNQLPSDPKSTLLKKDVNKPKPINGNITDMGFLNEFCDGDAIRMKKYIDIYVKGTPANLSKINVAIEDGDLQLLKLLIRE